MKKPLLFPILFVAFVGTLSAQTAALSLAGGSGQPGGVVSVAMNLAGSANPAGVQWTMSYPTALTFESATIGPAAPTKNISCSPGGAGPITCVVFGINTDTIANGAIANLAFRIASAAAAGPADIQLSNLSATSPQGSAIAATGTGGTINISTPGPLARSVVLSWTDLSNPTSTTYNAYRANATCADAPAGAFVRLNAQPITAKTYTDPGIAPGTYCYFVRAELAGLESDDSNQAEASAKPAPPTSFSVVVEVAVNVKPDGEVIARLDVTKGGTVDASIPLPALSASSRADR